MKTPACLKKGDVVGIVSPAGLLSEKQIKPAIAMLEKWGLNVRTGKNIFNRNFIFAGTDKERAFDFQMMLDDDEVKAIFCSRGGYGTIRIIQQINFTKFIKNPKWVIGYSDITVLHCMINRLFQTETIHAVMLVNYPPDGIENSSVNSLKKILFGEQPVYRLPFFLLNRQGQAKGELTGGNLSVLYSMTNTRYEAETKGKILFIEDVGEYLYHLDRMMINLKLRGTLSGLKGLIVGRMSRMKNGKIPFGKPAYEIIAEHVADYDYPVCYQFPSGHSKKNIAMVFGRQLTMNVNKKETVFEFIKD